MEEEDHCDHPSRVRAIHGAGDDLNELRRLGWATIIISNQSGIGRGYFTMADYEAVNAELFRQMGHVVDGAYCCPDHPDQATPRRKPGTGMVEEAVRDHDLDVTRSWFIGDKPIDVACGKTAGCRTILVRTGYGAKAGETGADHVVDNITAALNIILSEEPDEVPSPS